MTRRAMLLVGGQAVGQIGLLVALPFATRAYLPAELALFALGNAIALLVQPLATLRVEFVIPSMNSDGAARRTARLGGATIVGAVSTIALVALIASTAGKYDAATVACIAGLLLATYALVAIDNAVLVRRGMTARLATRNLVSGLLAGGAQIAVCLMSLQVAYLALAVFIARTTAVAITRTRWRPLVALEDAGERWRPRRFIPTVASSVLANANTNLLPLAVSATGSAPAVGYAGTAQRIASAPMSFLGQAMSQIIQTSAAPVIRDRDAALGGSLSRYYKFAILPSALVGLGLAILGPLLAEPILGTQWGEVGVILAILAVPYAMQLAIAPTAVVLVMIGDESVLLWFSAIRLAITGGATVGVAVASSDLLAVVMAFAIASAIFYVLQACLVSKRTRRWDVVGSRRGKNSRVNSGEAPYES